MLRLVTVVSLVLVAAGGCGRTSRSPSASEEASKGLQQKVPSKQPATQPTLQQATQPTTQPAPALQPASDDAQPAVVADYFREVTHATGINFSYSNGRSANEFAIIESLGGGVAVLDFDRDGRADLMFAGGGTLNDKTVRPRSCGLFRNLGEVRFSDSTTAALATADQFFTHGISVGDFDSDGFQDLAISGYGGVQLLHNQGDGTFVALPPLISNDTEAWSSSLAWADLDNNGFLDLYVTHYVDWSWQKHPQCSGQGKAEREVCGPRDFNGVTDVIYFNDGHTLHRNSPDTGLRPQGKGLGVAISDLNEDGFVDIYIANDTVDNWLYLNDGHGRFSETAVFAGVSGDDAGVSTGSMGVTILDANNDCRPDIFVTNFERELSALYRYEGEGLFTYASRKSGFAAYPAGFVGFGTVAIDFNFDGAQDLAVANGHVSYASPHSPYEQHALLFERQAEYFQRLTATGYFSQPHTGRGLAYGDLDNDGAVELIFSNLEEPVAVLHAQPPQSSNWAILRLIGTTSNRDAVGASVALQAATGRSQCRTLIGGGSYLSHSDQRIHLYWPKTSSQPLESVRVTVRWPTGESEAFELQAVQENVLVQGLGELNSTE